MQTARRIIKKALDIICYLLIAISYIRAKKTINKQKIVKILLINLQGIGDVLMTTPLLRAIKNGFPTAEIDYCVYKDNGALIEKDVYKILRRENNSILSKDFFKTLRNIQREKYELVINLFHAQHSALFTICSGAQYKLGNLYSTRATSNNLNVPHGNATWDVRINACNIARQLNIEIEKPEELNITIDKKTEQKIKKQHKKPYILINPHANWLSKKWPATRWADLIVWLMETYKDYEIIIIGAEKDSAYAEHIACLAKKTANSNNIKDICGKDTLEEIAARIKNAALMITTDSGPMHISIAAKTKTLALFGVTNPDILVSKAENIHVISKYSECPKRFRFNHNNEPPDWNRICMKKITMKEIKEAVEMILT